MEVAAELAKARADWADAQARIQEEVALTTKAQRELAEIRTRQVEAAILLTGAQGESVTRTLQELRETKVLLAEREEDLLRTKGRLAQEERDCMNKGHLLHQRDEDLLRLRTKVLLAEREDNAAAPPAAEQLASSKARIAQLEDQLYDVIEEAELHKERCWKLQDQMQRVAKEWDEVIEERDQYREKWLRQQPMACEDASNQPRT